MYKLIFIGLIFSVGCKTAQQNIKIKRILNIGCASNSIISIGKDSLIILENLSSNSKDSDFSYRNFVVENDTLVNDNFSHLRAFENLQILNSMKNASLFIDTFGKYQFKYDAVPDTMNRLFNKEEEIVWFKSHKYNWFYLTRNNSNAVWKLYCSKENNNGATAIILSAKPETPNFLLFDIIGDKKPEVFVFRNTYFMGRDLIDIDIFLIGNQNN